MAEIGFSSGKKERGGQTLNRWWNSPKESVASDLTAYCAALELAGRDRRFRSYAYHMVATGNAPISFGLSMPNGGGAVAALETSYGGDYFDAEFTPPAQNCCAIAIDVFANKIWCQEPFLQWIPQNDSSVKLRQSCKEATAYTDQVFNDLNLWDLVQSVGKSSGIAGTGWAWVRESVEGQLDAIEVDDDCVLLDPTAGANPRAWQLRLFFDREVLLRKYASDEKSENYATIKAKIEGAPGCRLGFFEVPIGYKDTIALCAGWYCDRGDGKGRFVLAIDDCALEDEEYEYADPPLAWLKHEPISGGARGQGCTEQQLSLQREIDRRADNIAEQERISAWNRAQSRVGNGVQPEDLSGNNLIEYTIEPVKFEMGLAAPAQLYAANRDTINDCLMRVGISQGQTTGTASPGIDAAVAIQAEMEISDVRHRGSMKRLERFVERLGKLLIRQASKTKPEVMYQGRKIDFTSVEAALKSGHLRAYPMSGLPQSIAARRQEIYDRWQSGEIDRAQYRRLMDMPYLAQATDEVTASLELIYDQLDEIVEEEKFVPVLPFSNLPKALSLAVTRYQIEARRKSGKKVLQLLAMYISQVRERIKEAGGNPDAPSGQAAQPQQQGNAAQAMPAEGAM